MKINIVYLDQTNAKGFPVCYEKEVPSRKFAYHLRDVALADKSQRVLVQINGGKGYGFWQEEYKNH